MHDGTQATLKRTPLYAAHVEMGAKMVDFGGWEMPLHYGSQLDEHHRVRDDAGMFDVSHMQVVDIRGEAARAFLRRLLANNIDKLTQPGKALYSCMLNETGGVIDDLIVYFMREDWFRMVVNASTAQKDVAWMREVAAGQVELAVRDDTAMIAVQGPNARAKTWAALPEVRAASEPLKPFNAAEAGEFFIGRTGYTGEDGFEIILPRARAIETWHALAQAGVAPIGLGARDTLRLEAGMNLYGQDMDEQTSPLEAGLAWTVDLGAGRDFIGRPALESAPLQAQLVGLLLLDRGVLRSHQRIITSHGEGEIKSGSFSPTLAQSIALARVPREVAVDDLVQVEVRDKLLSARVVKYPFVRNGRRLV